MWLKRLKHSESKSDIQKRDACVRVLDCTLILLWWQSTIWAVLLETLCACTLLNLSTASRLSGSGCRAVADSIPLQKRSAVLALFWPVEAAVHLQWQWGSCRVQASTACSTTVKASIWRIIHEICRLVNRRHRGWLRNHLYGGCNGAQLYNGGWLSQLASACAGAGSSAASAAMAQARKATGWRRSSWLKLAAWLAAGVRRHGGHQLAVAAWRWRGSVRAANGYWNGYGYGVAANVA